MARKLAKRFLLLLAIPVFLIASYMAFAFLGALVPYSAENREDENTRRLSPPVYLIGTMLHTDIAIPLNSLSLQKFSFLREAGMPLDNPALKYLVVGWGSREFYTETADYSDIRFATAWQAATGDGSVMHVAPAGDLSAVEDVTEVQMTEAGFARMLEFIRAGFRENNGGPILLDATFGFGDLFYESPEYFHLLRPCNVWTAAALREGGLTTGRWTPTTFSLSLALKLHN